MNKIISNEELLKISNNTTFQKYYNQFTLLALNMFEWENLPEGIETRHIEKPLIEYGYSFFYNDENFGFVCLPCTITGFNIYNEPTQITINNQIIHKTMKIEEGVLILNNDLRTGPYPIIMNYASRLSEIETSINTNIYSRQHYNFLKCNVCHLISDTIPREHQEEIKQIFESGITMWHLENGVKPLDYSVANHSK